MLVNWISRETKTKVDITALLNSVELSGEYRSCCRALNLEILSTTWDIYYKKIDIKLGDEIEFTDDNKLIFYGRVWNLNKATNNNTLNIHCKDFGIYLLKNIYTYKFVDMSPEEITKKICGDYGIETSSIASTDSKISRNYINTALYNIIMTSYYLSDTGKYMIRFDGKKLSVIKKGEHTAKYELEKWTNLLSLNASESLDSMVNTVYVRDEEDKTVINTLKNNDDLQYGLLSTTYKKEKDKDYDIKANKLLKGVDRKIEVTNFGNSEYITGNAVIIHEPWTKVDGLFYIDSDTHTWKSGLYTNKLTLNFENIVDDTESGQEIEEDKKSTKKKKKGKESGMEYKYINKLE